MLDCHFYRLLYIVYRSVCIISSITVADVKKKFKNPKSPSDGILDCFGHFCDYWLCSLVSIWQRFYLEIITAVLIPFYHNCFIVRMQFWNKKFFLKWLGIMVVICISCIVHFPSCLWPVWQLFCLFCVSKHGIWS